MAVKGDAQVAQAMELLREAGRLDLLIRSFGYAGHPMRKVSAEVAAGVRAWGMEGGRVWYDPPLSGVDREGGMLYPRLQWQEAHSATVTTYKTEGDRVQLDYEEVELVEDDRQEGEED
ncbi:hypothetical protein NDU88_001118 [Pleurodeles waltl]|uniref:Uncharacterized protein n=1 Tax=Pleurodeles waltl TaxID=8319 RepID=A0AAV7SYK8_PLEWA|nr:hypothetical protein NDU88_001118 [Pleurodeles waltl]